LSASRFPNELWPGDERRPTYHSVIAGTIRKAQSDCMSPTKPYPFKSQEARLPFDPAQGLVETARDSEGAIARPSTSLGTLSLSNGLPARSPDEILSTK